MITLSQVNQYANANNISGDTDIFSILSRMGLEYREQTALRVSPTPSSHVEWTTEEVLDLFSS